jgi:subtilase family serine protease
MGRLRNVTLAASLALAAGAVGTLPGAASAGASGSGPVSAVRACGAVPVGHSTCLVEVLRHSGAAAAAPSPLPTAYPPSTIEKAYGFSSSDHGTGAGETIGIVDAYNDPTIASNLKTFSKEYSLPTCTTTGCFSKVNQTGGTSYPRNTSGWDVEISLDVEWAHAIAPQAHILLVEATSTSDTNLFDAVKYAAAHAQYVSMSWGGGEFSGEKTFDGDFSASDSFFAAAGDSGSSVIYPSSSPDVISVGGTTLTVTLTGAWKAESAWRTGGGGCSTVETASAAQAAFPTYDQTGVPCKGKRGTPDVGLDANPTTGVSIYDSVPNPTFGTGWEQVGGTSVATPIWASHSAAAADHVNATFVYGANIKFYDITTGTNGHTCVKGYNLCDGLGSWNTTVGTVNEPPAGALMFTTSTVSVKAGAPTGTALTIRTSSAPSGTVTAALTSSSGAGEFSTSATGPYTASLGVAVTTAATTFYYRDTKAGSPTLTASATDWTSGSRTVTVTAGTLSRIAVTPSSVTLGEGATQTFTATGYDAYTNQVTSGFSPTWSTTVPGGSVSPSSGTSTKFTAGSAPTTGTVTAKESGVSGSASVTVTTTPALHVSVTAGAELHSGSYYRVPINAKVTSNSGTAVSGATVTLDVYSGSCSGRLVGAGRATTNSTGTASFTFTTATTGSYCAKATATKTGYTTGTGTTTFSVPAVKGSFGRQALAVTRP